MTYRYGVALYQVGGEKCAGSRGRSRNTFRHLSVQIPWRANCFANYGGNDNHFEDVRAIRRAHVSGILIETSSRRIRFGSASPPHEYFPRACGRGDVRREHRKPGASRCAQVFPARRERERHSRRNVENHRPNVRGARIQGFGSAYVQSSARVLTGAPDERDNAKLSNVTLKGDHHQRGNVRHRDRRRANAKRRGGSRSIRCRSRLENWAINKGGAPDSFFDKVGSNQGW